MDSGQKKTFTEVILRISMHSMKTFVLRNVMFRAWQHKYVHLNRDLDWI